ncbi:LysE family transporter [Streptomyces sp. NPDC089799]|uniref:LysE family transporter n=1 Tax=Streptomyces sp. NPDC089799 TaxID=3155066 RepID=UPI00343BDE09
MSTWTLASTHAWMNSGAAGAVAGLGVAVPMGAMSVLLLQEALRSRKAAVAGAAGIAAVDFAYAAVAVVVGPWVASHVTPVEAWVRLAAAAILLSLSGHGLWSTLRGPRSPDPEADADAGASTGAGSGAGAGRTFARYVALTAVNPTTALYFAALTTAQGAELGSTGRASAFVAGVLLASMAWQQFLAAVGSFAGNRISPAIRTWSFRLGYALVAAYAVKIAFPLP